MLSPATMQKEYSAGSLRLSLQINWNKQWIGNSFRYLCAKKVSTQNVV